MRYILFLLIAFTTTALIAQDTVRAGKYKGRKIRSYERTMLMDSSA